jgi:RNA polymerase sigma factor (TIGR02999 family)
MLAQLGEGNEAVVDRLLPLVYDELRRLAQYHLQYERSDHTINATALVHEVYLKLAAPAAGASWKDRAHFMAVASRAMRQILVDYARARNRLKRGGDAVRVSLDKAFDQPSEEAEDVLILDEMLTRLEALNPQHSRIVECRYFGGLTLEETAAVLDTSVSSVKRGWRAARAWLYREMYPPS